MSVTLLMSVSWHVAMEHRVCRSHFSCQSPLVGGGLARSAA